MLGRSCSVLIDDRLDLRENWEARGGIFVHHTNTKRTLRKLVQHGILSADVTDSFNVLQMDTISKEDTIYELPPDTP